VGGGGVDGWANTRLRAGDLVATIDAGATAAAGAAGTFTGSVAVPIGVADSMGDSAGRHSESLQLAPGGVAATLRAITVFRVTEDIDVAASHALANPQYGAGGGVRIFIPDLHELVARGALTVVQVRPSGRNPAH
jgi:hypothetical protein